MGCRNCRAQQVRVGTLFSTERSPLFSRACLHHRSNPATLNSLNGLAGRAVPCSDTSPPCLFFTASSSLQLFLPPPLSPSVFPSFILIYYKDLVFPPHTLFFVHEINSCENILLLLHLTVFLLPHLSQSSSFHYTPFVLQ